MKHSILKKTVFLSLVSIFLTSQSGAHGEDKFGPHKGYVRMPGAFHTELVLNGKNKLKVYLLDIDWKNPTVEKSSLDITYNGQTKGECKPQKDYFSCEFPKSIDLRKNGELKVVAVRGDQKGADAMYPLPLKLEVPPEAPAKSDHSGHGGHH